MHELLPIGAGIALAVATQRMESPRLRLAALVLLSVVFGALASWINGELELSWGFVSVDTALVLFAAAVTTAAVTAWERRTAARRIR